MPDDRLFHKRLGHSEKVNSLTDFEDRVWRAYVLSADDFGVMRFSAVTLQADHDYCGSRPQRAVQKALERVRAIGLIATFEHQGRTYCCQLDWQNHQRVKHPRQTINPMPPPDMLERCSPATRALFQFWPGKRRELLEKDFGNVSETDPHLARAGARVMAHANASGYRLPAQSVRPGVMSPGMDPDLSERAGRFLERYAELHVKYRHGAAYLGKPAIDFQEALLLCRTYDDATLDKLAIVFLNADDDFSASGTRTVAKFRSRASWCDERLKQKGL